MLFSGFLECVCVWICWWKAITHSLVLFQWFGNDTQLTPFTSKHTPLPHTHWRWIHSFLYIQICFFHLIFHSARRTLKDVSLVINFFTLNSTLKNKIKNNTLLLQYVQQCSNIVHIIYNITLNYNEQNISLFYNAELK